MKHSDEMDRLVDILHEEGCSCVIANGGEVHICHERGVKDLFRLLKSKPEVLSGSMIADKVIGKGAAAIMVLGGAKEVYADVISEPALALLRAASVPVACKDCVPNIINRAGTGICPIEQLCKDCVTASDCLPRIEAFVDSISKH